MKTSKKLNDYFNAFFDTVESEEPVAEFKVATRLIFEFGQYVDMMAGSNPHTLHHVYEWGMVGQPDGRLFELTAISTGANTVITYELLESIVPNENGEVFTHKATVMESGRTVTFTTDKPVPINDGEEFRVGSFTFVPGGTDTNGAFRETFMLYFASRPSLVSSKNVSVRPSELSRAGGKKDGRRLYDRIISQ